MNQIEITVPATLANLGPGFDCFGLAVNLFNVVRAQPAKDWALRFSGPYAGQLVPTPDNLLWQALSRCVEAFELRCPPLEVEVEVHVPPGRGMGSSATAVAAGLALAAHFGGKTLDALALAQLGTRIEGHPDNIVPALVGGLCLCLEEGHLRFEPVESLGFLALTPRHEVSTKEARAALPSFVSMKDAVFNLSRASLLAVALATGKLDSIRALDLVRDRLHQPVRSKHIPGFDAAVAAGLKAGALGVCISGSGPTVLALLDRREGRAHAIEAALRQELGVVQSRFLLVEHKGVLAQIPSVSLPLALRGRP